MALLLIPDLSSWYFWSEISLKLILPSVGTNLLLYVYLPLNQGGSLPGRYQMEMKVEGGKVILENIRRGICITGAAGSGKTESVVYNLLQHFQKYSFSGIIHDYKDFEITEMAYPIFKKGKIPFYIVSFERVFHRVNPIAPRYMVYEEDVNEVARVLLENLLEQKEVAVSGTVRFFNDAAEGLIAGMIWRLKTDFQETCTLPHLIALYQSLTTEELVQFLSLNPISKAMAEAFISGIESERQTAAVRSTLANALKKITSKRIFMALSSDEIPLNINNPENPAVVCIVNNPKFETAFSPVIATTIHSLIKQMSLRNKEPSFVLLEEAPTIRLLHMHRVPATLRSYNISTVYVMQDKAQNDLLYGEKASKAILSNLSYQFFGKVNDPDTAKYYERFFEMIHKENISISQSGNLNFDTRITKSKREVAKLRSDLFFKLAPGEFVSFTDGVDQRVQFKHRAIPKFLPTRFKGYSEEEIAVNFAQVYSDIIQLRRDL